MWAPRCSRCSRLDLDSSPRTPHHLPNPAKRRCPSPATGPATEGHWGSWRVFGGKHSIYLTRGQRKMDNMLQSALVHTCSDNIPICQHQHLFHETEPAFRESPTAVAAFGRLPFGQQYPFTLHTDEDPAQPPHTGHDCCEGATHTQSRGAQHAGGATTARQQMDCN